MKTGMFFLCLFVLSVFAPVSGQTTIDTPIRFSHVNRDRDAMGKLYREMFLPASQHPQGWTEPGNCQPGKLSAATLKARLTEINYFRKMAGLKPVSLDPDYNQKAQAAAYLMFKNGSLSHNPPTSWKCYTKDAAAGAGSSNLGFGGGLDSYIYDQGSSNQSCGHRMWILRGRAKTFGYGGTEATDAIYVFGDTEDYDSLPQYVAWPPAGFIPSEILSDRWTFSLPSESADYSKATATLTLNGKPVALNFTQSTGYGDGGMSFEIANWYEMEKEMLNQKVKVQIKGVKVGAEMRSYTYEVAPFEADTEPTYVTYDNDVEGLRVEAYSDENDGESKNEADAEETEVEKPFAEMRLGTIDELSNSRELAELTVAKLQSLIARDIVMDPAFCKFAAKVSALRKEKNPDPIKVNEWATGKIKAYLAGKAGLDEAQALSAAAPKFMLLEITKLVPLNGAETFEEITAEFAKKFAANPELKAFALKYKRIRQCGFGLACKPVKRDGRAYAGVYATVVLAPAGLRTSS
ncbi:MAG: hypothetical protein IPN95_13465 [Bacteroidetes bacterium]|nr:hypothetical protein [Bacteroidota bacterium]